MTPQIVKKIQDEINAGITKESQVVYLLVGIRKILEQENIPEDSYFYLRFHCDWALHASLNRKPAQYVLSHFSSARLQLLKGENLAPNDEADKMSKMDQFQEEISDFLRAHSMTDFSQSPDAWPRFLYLYARVIQDVPLIIRDGSSSEIQEVVVSVEMAKESVVDHRLFRVLWNITDKSGKSGTIYVINSYQADK